MTRLPLPLAALALALAACGGGAPRPQSAPTATPGPLVIQSGDAPWMQADYASTKAVADAASASANATAMWAGATGTAAYIAPTQDEYNRQTQQAAARTAQSDTSTQAAQLFSNHRTETAEAVWVAQMQNTQAAATATQAADHDTMTAIPPRKTLEAKQTADAEVDRYGTRVADWNIGQQRLQQKADEDKFWQSFWRVFGVVFAIVFIASTVLISGALLNRIEKKTDAETAEPKARANEINQRGIKHKTAVLTDGTLVANVGGVPTVVGKVAPPEQLPSPAAPPLHDPIRDSDLGELDYYTDAQREAIELLDIAIGINGGASRIIPRHDALCVGAERRTMFVRSLARAGLCHNPKHGVETVLRDSRSLAEVREMVADGAVQIPEIVADEAPYPVAA